MQKLRAASQLFLIYLLMGVMGVVGAPFVLWKQSWTRDWMKLYIRSALALTRWICGIRVEVRGPVPTGAVVIASKHQSLLDVLILFETLPQPHFVMKRSLVWAPVFGLYALRAGCIWITREKRGEGNTMLRRLEGKHGGKNGGKNGEGGSGQIVIYPQGTRVPPGEVRPYRSGAAMAYKNFGLPMVLAATNVGWFWPKKGLIRRPGTAVLQFLETVPPGISRSNVMRQMEASIEAASDRLGEEAAAGLGLSITPQPAYSAPCPHVDKP